MTKTTYSMLALAIVGLAVVAMPAFAGHAVVSRMSEQTAALQKLLPGLALEEQVERGLFSTTRTVKVRLGCPPKPGDVVGPGPRPGQLPQLELRWRDQIKHGPLPGGKAFALATIDSALLLSDELAKQAQPILAGQPPLRVHSQIGFRGEFESDVQVPTVRVQSGGEDVDFSGVALHVTGHLPLAAGPLTYRASMAPVAVAIRNEKVAMSFDVGEVDSSGSMQLDPKFTSLFVPFQGEGKIQVIKINGKALSVGGAQPMGDFALTNLTFKSQATTDKDLWSMQTSMAGALTVLGFTIEKFEFASALRRMHIPSYTKLTNKLIAASTSCDQPRLIDDPKALLEAIHADLFELLVHDPEYAVGPIAVELAGKRAELSYSLATHGITPDDKTEPFSSLLKNKAVTVAAAKVDLGLIDEVSKLASKLMGLADPSAATSAGAPDTASMMARAMIGGFVEQGYLTRDGESVQAKFESAGGTFKLNGKPIELPELPDLSDSDLDDL